MYSKEPRNEKGEPHGYWEKYWTTSKNNGKLWYKGSFANGEPLGKIAVDWTGSGLMEIYYYAK